MEVKSWDNGCGDSTVQTLKLGRMKPLRVDVAGLQRVSGELDALAATLGTTPCSSSHTAGASWQSSVAEVAKTRSEAGQQRAAFTGRVRSTASKVASAGGAYSRFDAGSAAALAGQVV